MSPLHNVPLRWRVLIGGQVLLTVGLMLHRMDTMGGLQERKPAGGEGRFAPPEVGSDLARRKTGTPSAGSDERTT